MTEEEAHQLGTELMRIGSILRLQGKRGLGERGQERYPKGLLLMAAVNHFNRPDGAPNECLMPLFNASVTNIAREETAPTFSHRNQHRNLYTNSDPSLPRNFIVTISTK